MSIIDVNEISDVGLVAQYVVELFGHGHFLSREDYSKIQNWLKLANSTDDLLLVLDDVLNKKIEKSRGAGKKVFSLSSIQKTVERRIMDQRSLLQGASAHE